MKAALALLLIVVGGAANSQARDGLQEQFGPFVGSPDSWGAYAYCSGFLSVLDVGDPDLQQAIDAEATSLFERFAVIHLRSRAEDISSRVAAHWQDREDSPQARIDMGLVLQHCLSFASNPDLRGETDLNIR